MLYINPRFTYFTYLLTVAVVRTTTTTTRPATTTTVTSTTTMTSTTTSQQVRDPCATLTCRHGAVCLIEDETPHCRCPPSRCTSSAGLDDGPVCGTDRQDYSSECEMIAARCRQQKHIRKLYDGYCGTYRPKGAITSKTKHTIKLKTSPARLAQLLQSLLAFCFTLQPMTAYRP